MVYSFSCSHSRPPLKGHIWERAGQMGAALNREFQDDREHSWGGALAPGDRDYAGTFVIGWHQPSNPGGSFLPDHPARSSLMPRLAIICPLWINTSRTWPVSWDRYYETCVIWNTNSFLGLSPSTKLRLRLPGISGLWCQHQVAYLQQLSDSTSRPFLLSLCEDLSYLKQSNIFVCGWWGVKTSCRKWVSMDGPVGLYTACGLWVTRQKTQ